MNKKISLDVLRIILSANQMKKVTGGCGSYSCYSGMTNPLCNEGDRCIKSNTLEGVCHYENAFCLCV